MRRFRTRFSLAGVIPILETPRLVMRPFAPEDAGTVEALAGDARVAVTTLNIPHPYPSGLAATWIDGTGPRAERGEGVAWAITERANGRLMGAMALSLALGRGRGELGYWLGVPFWNSGFTTEAARRAVAFGFEELGLHRIQAMCLPDNVGSSRVMEKIGLAYEGRLRGYYLKGERLEDVLVYAILRTDPRL